MKISAKLQSLLPSLCKCSPQQSTIEQVKDTRSSGAGVDAIHTPRLWYYDLLSFLNENNINTRAGKETGGDEEEEDDATNVQEQLLDAEVNHPRKRRRGDNRERQELLTMAKKLLESKPDQWEGLSLAYCAQLRELQNDQQAVAQKLISEVLCLGKLRLLSPFSSITIPSYPTQGRIIPPPNPSPPIRHVLSSPSPSPSSPSSSSFMSSQRTSNSGSTTPVEIHLTESSDGSLQEFLIIQ